MEIKKILLVNIGFPPYSLGGTEFYTYHLSKMIKQFGHEVVVLTALPDVSLPQYKIVEDTFDGVRTIKIVNSPIFAESFEDFFVDKNIDCLVEQILENERPDLIHVQHLAYLSGNLFKIAKRLNIPTIATLHDYWYLCFRSQLLHPKFGICSGPDEGRNCAQCHDCNTPNPTAIPRFPNIVRVLHKPNYKPVLDLILTVSNSEFATNARTFFLDQPQNEAENADVTSISHPLHLAENKARFEFFKSQFELPSFVLSPSFYLKKRYEAEGYRNIDVLPLGFPQINPPHPLPYSRPLKLSFIGNIERHKGVHLLLEELCQLENIDGLVEINIYGQAKDSIYFSYVKKLANKFPAGAVQFHGSYRSDRDMKTIFSNTHVSVFPSLWEENFPLVVNEALLYGVPVIASMLGGVSEIIQHSENGLRFDPYIKKDLVQTVMSLIESEELFQKISLGAQNTKINSIENHTAELLEFYDSALSMISTEKYLEC